MKRARPLQESNCQPRATRSTTADVKNDVKAAIRTTFGAKITANADVLQKENEKRAIAATQKRALETRERSLKAGLDRVGPNTPIGKISARIKRVKSEASVPSIKPVQTLSDAELDGILATAVVEVKQMYAQRGITAARKYMDAFPTRMGMSGCRNKLSYWAACIDLERDAKEWDRVAELFERARVNVSCAEEQHSLQTLFESFEHEADEMFEEERQRLDER